MTGRTFHLNADTLPVLAEIGQHMPGGFLVCIASEPGELLFANNAVVDLYGCDDLDDLRRLTGNTFHGMVHPEDYAMVWDAAHHRLHAGEGSNNHVEHRILRKDGEVRWVDDYGHYTKTDAYGGLFSVFITDVTSKHERFATDIAAHKATIKTLSESNEKLAAERMTFSRVAQALAGDYFSICVIDLATDYFNEYSATGEYDQLRLENTGDDFFNMRRRNIESLIYPDDRDRFMAVFTKEKLMAILERDGNFTMKYRMMFDSVPKYVSLKATLMEDEHGRHLIIGTNLIDAQMKLEQEYQRRVAEVHDKVRNDFLANMSHDIRTPMNAIVGYTNIATSHLDEPDTVRDSLQKIGSASHFLLSLINDILDISKIDSGKLQLNMADCNLADVFARIEDITRLQASNKALRITYEKSGVRHLRVRADELRLEQILVNIVTNAIKYTPEGKSVSLTAQEEPLPQPGKHRYRFIISDTGVGISEEFLPHIFESFTREQNTTINRIQGTGLGLSITARVVELMGGNISVQSKLGEGSTFTVEVDLEESAPAEPAEERPCEDETEQLAGRRVLLVEDNDINAEIAQLILAQFAIESERAENGSAGVERLKSAPEGYFDAVLMDIQMPVMNGYEATRAIRALEGPRGRVPVIAMSANAYDDDVRQCIAVGMNAHIAKPFQPHELFSTLRRYILSES